MQNIIILTCLSVLLLLYFLLFIVSDWMRYVHTTQPFVKEIIWWLFWQTLWLWWVTISVHWPFSIWSLYRNTICCPLLWLYAERWTGQLDAAQQYQVKYGDVPQACTVPLDAVCYTRLTNWSGRPVILQGWRWALTTPPTHSTPP